MEELVERVDNLESDMKNIKRAFPRSSIGEIDYMGHREYHEQVIASAREQEMFWKGLRNDLAKKGAWSVILIVLGLVAHGFMLKIGMLK